MIFSKNVAISVALAASQFFTGASAAKVQDQGEILKRALAEAGISGEAAANILGVSAAAYKGYEAGILGDHLASAAASDGIDAGLPFGLAEGGIHRDADASILKRRSSTRSEEGEIFKRFLDEAGYDADSANILDQIVDVVKKDDEESNIMKRQIVTAFGDQAASKMLAGVSKRSEPEIPSNNKVGVVKRALIEGSIGADANAEILGASAGAYAGAEGEVLGDHLAEATASAGVGAELPLGLGGANVDGEAGASVLKRALAEAGISGEAAANILGASAAAYKGYEAGILGDHLASATASDGIDAGLPFGLAEGGIHRDAGASILKRALADAGISGAAAANILGASAAAYKGYEAGILGDHLASAAASDGIDAGLPFGLAEGGIHRDADASILKRALIEGSIGADANAELLGASAGAYAGAEGEVLGDHLAEATASAGIGAELPLGLGGANVDGEAGASVLKRALAEAGISGEAAANVLGASAAAYKGYEAGILGDHLASATASDGIDAGLPFGLAEGGIHRDADAQIL